MLTESQRERINQYSERLDHYVRNRANIQSYAILENVRLIFCAPLKEFNLGNIDVVDPILEMRKKRLALVRGTIGNSFHRRLYTERVSAARRDSRFKSSLPPSTLASVETRRGLVVYIY